MLDRVEARQRIDRARLESVEAAHVALHEAQAVDMALERPDVHDGDGHERQKVRHEAVDPRSDVDVHRGTPRVDQPRRPQILVEVLAARDPRLGVEVGEDR